VPRSVPGILLSMARRPNRNRMREYVIAALLALVIVWLVSLIFGIARKEEIARTTVAETKEELAQLEVRKETLQANIAELGTDRGQEASLRQTFGVAKPGEEVIIVVTEKDLPPPPEVTWWARVLHFFGI
jgi:cell division protein FtsB